jgi:hypothetical protein
MESLRVDSHSVCYIFFGVIVLVVAADATHFNFVLHINFAINYFAIKMYEILQQ